MWLVAGLGNPGAEYETTRHNVGFLVADELARRWGAPAWRTKFGAALAQAEPALLVKPQEYMNLSGQALGRAAAFFKIESAAIIVVHDEIDLPFATVRVKVAGGHGGHNGLRSIISTLGESFVRVRVGVGKPEGGKERVIGHVLSGFSKSEKVELPRLVGDAADAVELILQKGPTAAMNQVNTDKR